MRRIVSAVRSARPEVLINAAAYTAVDRAEREPDAAYAINAAAVAVLAEEAKPGGDKVAREPARAESFSRATWPGRKIQGPPYLEWVRRGTAQFRGRPLGGRFYNRRTAVISGWAVRPVSYLPIHLVAGLSVALLNLADGASRRPTTSRSSSVNSPIARTRPRTCFRSADLIPVHRTPNPRAVYVVDEPEAQGEHTVVIIGPVVQARTQHLLASWGRPKCRPVSS